MEKKHTRPMTPFDELTIPYPFSILKLLLPYLVPGGRSPLWILIKFMELQYTISIFKHPETRLSGQPFGHFPDSPAELLEEIAPYLPPEQEETIDTFRSILNMMNMMDMMKAMQPMDGTSGDCSETDSTNTPEMSFPGMNPMDLMMGMLSPEQQEMFQTYQEMFSDTETQTNSKTGDDDYGTMAQQPASKKHEPGETGTDSDGSLPDTGEIR